MNSDISNDLVEQVRQANTDKSTLFISAGGSKLFYGNKPHGEKLDVTQHTGIIEYQPSELVVTVRSGTLLSDLKAELKANNQILAFEPPQHSDTSTIGGVIACGLSGPRRVACGSARDFVLGTTIINGKGEKLRFGGQVMKNVAGYDASRLMVGAQGTLGVLLDISLKILPLSETEESICIQIERDLAIKQLQSWITSGLPVSASCHHNNTLFMRLGSTSSAVKQAKKIIRQQHASEEINNDFWSSLCNQTHEFFSDSTNLWRCSHLPSSRFYEEDSETLLEWNGALRWIKTGNSLHTIAAESGGHACRYPVGGSGETHDDLFQPLPAPLLKIHQNLKRAFDPSHILNPGRQYHDI